MESKVKIEALGQPAIDFLLYTYLGIVQKSENLEQDTKRQMAKKCAQRAYLDMCRTLCYNKEVKEKERSCFVGHLCEWIVKQIEDKLIKKYKDYKIEQHDNFDSVHGTICNDLKDKAGTYKNKSGKIVLVPIAKTEVEKEKLKNGENLPNFYDGQAQKWLNMTLKYMWLIGAWKDEMEVLKKHLHVPVDSYIMQASSEQFKIKIPHKNGNSKKEYSESTSKPWSCWEYEEYIKFQNDLRDKQPSPIEWEGPAWIEVAQNRKKQEFEKISYKFRSGKQP